MSKPLLIVEPGTMTRDDIVRAEEQSGIVIVECAKPETMRFAEPPLDRDMDAQARAAMGLVRWVAARPSNQTLYYGDAIRFFVNALDGGGDSPGRVSVAKKVRP